jgi:hypothetical protein
MSRASTAASGWADAGRADRRLYRRYEMGLRARLRVGEAPIDGRITDLSLGGAGFAPERGDLVGSVGELAIGETGPCLTCKIVSAAAGCTHLLFLLSESEEAELAMLLVASV